MPRLNMKNYDSSKISNFKLVEPGTYMIKAVDAKVSYSANNNEMWFMTYEIVEQGSKYYGQKLFDNIVFSEKVMNRVKLIFEAFDVAMPDGEQDYVVENILGKFCRVQVTHTEKYENKEKQEREKSVIGFDGYYPVDGSERKKAEDEEIPF